MMRKSIIFLSMIFLLGGCSVFSPVKLPQTRYLLDSVPHVPVQRTHSMTLLVNPVETYAAYNTPQMAYTSRLDELNYYAKNAWVEPPGIMLHPLIIQTLENTHYYHAILSSVSAGRFDYVLNTQLLELRQIFFRKYSEVHLTVRAQLIHAATNRVIATRVISVIEPAPTNNPSGGVMAANRAVSNMLYELAIFCLRT